MNGDSQVTTANFYKIISGVFGAILLSMIAYFGNQVLVNVSDLSDSIGNLRSDLARALADVARNEGELNMLDDRVDRANGRQIELDRRVTIIETKLGR